MKIGKVFVPYLSLLVGPYATYVLGIALNKLCILANGGHMPYLAPGCMPDEDLLHTCWNAQVHLKFLADWIIFREGSESLGDLLIQVGAWTLIPGLVAWALFMIKDFNSSYSSRKGL